jgi:hypothetical protein
MSKSVKHSPPAQPLPRKGWLSEVESSAVRDTRICPDCGRTLLLALANRIGQGSHSRRMNLYLHFNNVHNSGDIMNGGLELYACSHCYCEFAYGPRTGDGKYRMLRLPR